MALEIRTVDKLKGVAPLTKIRHLYKTVCRRGLPVYLVEHDLLITPGIIYELMSWDVRSFDEWKDCYSKRVMLKLRKSWMNGPCRSSVGDSFKEDTKNMDGAVRLFFLLVWEKDVDTGDPAFLEGGIPKAPIEQGFA